MRLAAMVGDEELLRERIDLGEDTNSPVDVYGTTPIQIASMYGHLHIIKMLVKYGADLDAVDSFGCTSVFVAAFQGKIDVIEVLTQLGADINIPNRDGDSPISIAIKANRQDVALYLINLGADISFALMSQSRNFALNSTIIEDFRTYYCHIYNSNESCYMLAFVKLLSNFLYRDNYNFDASKHTRNILEKYILSALQQVTKTNIPIERINQVAYPTKVKLTKLSHKICSRTFFKDGDRLHLSAKVNRFVSLICLFLNEPMLRDLLSLRMTSKANHKWRRFPVDNFRELEINLIESFVALDVSRFVLTSKIHEAHTM
jgi:hypothetical protein